MTNPNKSNELIETIKEVRESLYKVSGSALLAGEKFKSEDKAIIYGLVCNANNLLLSVIDNLAAQASQATPQPQSVWDALKKAESICLDETMDWNSTSYGRSVSKRIADEIAAHIEPLSAADSEQDMRAAYVGAREDLQIWKRRALEAETALRKSEDINGRLVKALNAENGPTHMGEPVLAETGGQESEAQAVTNNERNNWNAKQWAEHVGAWENEQEQVCFGSWMALRAMLIQFSKTIRSAVTGGQESEAQAVAIVDAIEVDPSKRTLKSLSYERLQSIPAGTKLYTAPPSAIAIESAAKRQAAEVCRMWNTTPGSKLAKEILTTIPQDGITELEKFGMLVAEEASFYGLECGSNNRDMSNKQLRAIVKSLIGGEK